LAVKNLNTFAADLLSVVSWQLWVFVLTSYHYRQQITHNNN
jgi:hypothetical protein